MGIYKWSDNDWPDLVREDDGQKMNETKPATIPATTMTGIGDN